MDIFNSYTAIIAFSVIIILSFIFNLISRKTNIPSVLLLILLGIFIKEGIDALGLEEGLNLFPLLEILGIVGLIMIVLEAALDLKLTKEKWPIIWKSFSVALIALVFSAFICAFAINYFFGESPFISLIYALPLSILSSAIIIPSVGGLEKEKREFMVYEGTFSDILGIMFFYFLLGHAETQGLGKIIGDISLNIVITIAISVVCSYLLVYIFQHVKSHVKLFLLIAILLLLYAVGKLFHISSLIIILFFGLVLNNYNLFFKGFLRKYLKQRAVSNILKDMRLITIESAFLVRTFFFIVFGMSITLSSLIGFKVTVVSLIILAGLYLVRFLVLKLFLLKDITPQFYIAPRGLITILLFYAIPEEYQSESFDSGILLYVIIVSGLVMTIGMITSGTKIEEVEEYTTSPLDYFGNEEEEEAPMPNHEGGFISPDEDNIGEDNKENDDNIR